jgi:septal ring factor EnvC (AmiA/AmiB activator)
MSAGRDVVAQRAPAPRGARSWLALALATLSGCTIVQMRSDLQERQTRIDAKQEQLQSLRATNAQLAAESDRLRGDLQQRELNASELHARLDRLIQLNEAAKASSAQEQAEQAERRRQLQAVSRQAQALDQATGMSEEEKQEKLTALRAKTRDLLKILLAG